MSEATDKKMPFDRTLPPFPNPSAHTDFYKKFKREADEFDLNYFVKKYGDEADTTIIFAGLFSAVASAFIINIQSQLQPDYTQMSYALLTIIASVSLGKIPTGPEAAFPKWTGPDPAIVHVQAILYSSLAASLLAALVATLGKQWLHRLSQVEIGGSIVDRSRDRVRKSVGMTTWHFDLVMESLPLMLQIALLLLGYALSNYLFFVNRAVAGVIIGFTSFGLLFYLIIVSAGTLFYNCPFQTPASFTIRLMIRFDDAHRRYLNRSMKWFRLIFSFFRKWKRSMTRSLASHGLGNLNVADENTVGDHVELAATVEPLQLPSTLDIITFDGYVQDSHSINRLFEITTDADVILTITKLIPEIVWHAGIQIIPLERVYDTVLGCFDRSSRRPEVIPNLRNQAYFAARALLHLAIQRKCISHESDAAAFASISRRHHNMGSRYYGGDSDLESTLGIIDRVFKTDGFEEIPWQEFCFTDSHHAWMGHILLYRAWYALGNGDRLPDYVREFFLRPLRPDPPPPEPIVFHCLKIIGLVLGIRMDIFDQQDVDESGRFSPQLSRIYELLFETFQDPNHTTDEMNRALEAMKLICSLPGEYTATKSYSFFHVAMQAPISPTYSEENKWEASRLALHAAYKWDTALPSVNDPQNILTFISHHFELAAQGNAQDEPIQNALRALAYASSSEALKNFDPTQPSFVRGIRHVFHKDKPLRLRETALFFLPLIGDKWFNAPNPIMNPDKMRALCVDWASALDESYGFHLKKAALMVLLGMINSCHWRQHIVKDKWKLLEYSVPDDSGPFRKCLENTELVRAMSAAENREITTLWFKILWRKFKQLTPEVQAQLKEVTRTAPRSEVEWYLKRIEAEWNDVEHALMQYATWSTDPTASALRTRIESLEEARAFLAAVTRG